MIDNCVVTIFFAELEGIARRASAYRSDGGWVWARIGRERYERAIEMLVASCPCAVHARNHERRGAAGVRLTGLLEELLRTEGRSARGAIEGKIFTTLQQATGHVPREFVGQAGFGQRPERLLHHADSPLVAFDAEVAVFFIRSCAFGQGSAVVYLLTGQGRLDIAHEVRRVAAVATGRPSDQGAALRRSIADAPIERVVDALETFLRVSGRTWPDQIAALRTWCRAEVADHDLQVATHVRDDAGASHAALGDEPEVIAACRRITKRVASGDTEVTAWVTAASEGRSDLDHRVTDVFAAFEEPHRAAGLVRELLFGPAAPLSRVGEALVAIAPVPDTGDDTRGEDQR